MAENVRECFRRVLEMCIVDEVTVMVSTDSDSQYVRKDRPKVELHRTRDSATATPPVYILHHEKFRPQARQHIENVVSSSPDPENECLTVAHELGHHRALIGLPDPEPHYSNILEIEERLRGKTAVSFEETDRFYDEEVRAWKHAKLILEEAGWTDWLSFESHRDDALKTYERRIVEVMPEWRPPGA